ncbi:hypothetical protein OF83DRAFT_1144386 [Amylostereum chailletii]|nr:hypothetical protein OF83DRAFT_1144386 [Amylostereum chailletii]
MSLDSAIYHRGDNESLGRSLNSESHIPTTSTGPEDLAPGIQEHIGAGDNAVGKDNTSGGMLIDWDPHVARLPASPCRKWRNEALEFTSAERLMKPLVFFRNLLRDDIESFVHVLVYHVLRYRPAGFPSIALAQQLHYIFDWHTVVDGQYSGGDCKADYLRGGSYFTPTALIDSTLPSQLVALMNALRRPFRMFYLDPECMEDYPPLVVQKALAALDTANEFIAIFKAHLEVDGWPENDGAVDQLPPKELPKQIGATVTSSHGEKRKSAQEHDGRISKARK